MPRALIHYPRVLTSEGVVTLTVDGNLIELARELDGNRESLTLFISSWLSLLSDSPITRSAKPLRLYNRFLKELYADVRGVALRFADLAHEFVSKHTLMGTGTSIGPWIPGFEETPVFFEYQDYIQTSDPDVVTFLYSFLVFGKKMEYEDSAFHDTALRGWLENERVLGDLILSKDDPVIRALRSILAYVLPFPSHSSIWPKHGPGQTAEKTGRRSDRKHATMRYDPLIDRFLFHGQTGKYGMGEDLGYSHESVIPAPWNWSKKGISRARPPAVLKFVPKSLKVSRSICMEPVILMYFQQAIWRLMAESIESGPLRSFIKLSDQGYNRMLGFVGSFTSEIDTIDLSSASDRLSFELVKLVFPPAWLIPMTVTRSREVKLPNGDIHVINKFAPMGSALCFPTQCVIFACVGILAAHLDRISCSPQELPPDLGLDDIRRAIRSFRSDGAGEYRPSRRPMVDSPHAGYSRVGHVGTRKSLGNTCLPNIGGTLPLDNGSRHDSVNPCREGLVPEVEPSSDELGRELRSGQILRRERFSGPYLQPMGVYGDDICVDTRATHNVKAILRHIGFAINDDKSFEGGQLFRETCGGYYLNGLDITPIYYRVRGVSGFINPSQVWSQVHLINAARGAKFFRLASFLQHSLFKWSSRYERVSVPFVSDTSLEFGIRSATPRNKHLRMVYNDDLQRDEYLVWNIAPTEFQEVTYASENYQLMRWFASRYDHGSGDITSPGHTLPANSRIQWRWTPLY